MDADAKQTVLEEVLRRGYTKQDYNDCLIVAGFLQHAFKLDDVDNDHYEKARTANRNRMRQVMGDKLYFEHISSVTNPNRSRKAEDYLL